MSPFIPMRDRPFFVAFPKLSGAAWSMVRYSIAVVALELRTSSLTLFFVRPPRVGRDKSFECVSEDSGNSFCKHNRHRKQERLSFDSIATHRCSLL